MPKPKKHRADKFDLASGRCLYDGATLDEHGYCWQGSGFPYGPRCYFVCPLCRGQLAWDGGCGSCLGTGETMRLKQPREAWRVPGDEYRIVKGHWVKMQGASSATSLEGTKRNMRLVLSILSGDLRPADAALRLMP